MSGDVVSLDEWRRRRQERPLWQVLGYTPEEYEQLCDGCAWCDPTPVCTCQGRCVCGALQDGES